VLTLDSNFCQLGVEVFFSLLRRALWPFSKAKPLPMMQKVLNCQAKTPCDRNTHPYPNISLFDHIQLLCTLPGLPISIQVILAASSKK